MKYKKENLDFQIDLEELNAMMDIYRTGTEEQKAEVMLFFLDMMDGFMKSKCATFKNARESYEDMMSACKLAVLESLPKYDPLCNGGSRPLTFFGPRILHALQTAYNPEALSGHFSTIVRQLKKTSAKYDIPYEKDNIKKLAKIADIPYASAKEAFKRSQYTQEEYNPETVTTSQDMQTPEQAYEEQEKREMIREAINSLPPVERYVIEGLILQDFEVSELVNYMKIDKEKLGITGVIDKRRVNTIKRSALSKLEYILREQGFGRCSVIKPNFVRSDNELQIETDDIEAAINAELEDDFSSGLLVQL